MRSRPSLPVPKPVLKPLRALIPLLILSLAACDKTTSAPPHGDAGSSPDAASSDAGIDVRVDVGPHAAAAPDATIDVVANAGVDTAVDSPGHTVVDARVDVVVDSSSAPDRFDSRPPDAAASVGDFGRRYLRTLCKKVLGCCPAEALVNLGPFGASEASCVAAGEAAGFSESLEAELNAELRAGSVIYDEAKMTQCLADLAGWSCAALRKPGSDFSDLPTCKMALRGTRATGEACNTDFACVQGWCDFGAGSICADPLPNGEACFSSSECLSRECSDDSGTCVTATIDSFCSE